MKTPCGTNSSIRQFLSVELKRLFKIGSLKYVSMAKELRQALPRDLVGILRILSAVMTVRRTSHVVYSAEFVPSTKHSRNIKYSMACLYYVKLLWLGHNSTSSSGSLQKRGWECIHAYSHPSGQSVSVDVLGFGDRLTWVWFRIFRARSCHQRSILTRCNLYICSPARWIFGNLRLASAPRVLGLSIIITQRWCSGGNGNNGMCS